MTQDKRVSASKVPDGATVWLYDPTTLRSCHELGQALVPAEAPEAVGLVLHHVPASGGRAPFVVLCGPGDHFHGPDDWKGATYLANQLRVWTSQADVLEHHAERLEQAAYRIKEAAAQMRSDAMDFRQEDERA